MHFHLVHPSRAEIKAPASLVLTHGVIEDVPFSHAFLYLGQLQSHARTNLQTAQCRNLRRGLKSRGLFLNLPSAHSPRSGGRRSVVTPCFPCRSRPGAAPLCCARHLVPLRSLKGSPPWETMKHVIFTEREMRPLKLTFLRTVLHQQLADVLKLAHVGEFLLHQLLHAAAHAHGDDLQAAAGWGRDNVRQSCVLSAQQRILAVTTRLISAFTLKTSLNSQFTRCHHLSPNANCDHKSDAAAILRLEKIN